jgi:hypothetical protein
LSFINFNFLETRYSQQIENALNREQINLIDAINLFKYEKFFENIFSILINFRIWLIQQRIPSLLAHLNCRIYNQIPSLNPKHELILPFINNSIFIELIHNDGFYIVSELDKFLGN